MRSTNETVCLGPLVVSVSASNVGSPTRMHGWISCTTRLHRSPGNPRPGPAVKDPGLLVTKMTRLHGRTLLRKGVCVLRYLQTDGHARKLCQSVESNLGSVSIYRPGPLLSPKGGKGSLMSSRSGQCRIPASKTICRLLSCALYSAFFDEHLVRRTTGGRPSS